MEILSKSSLKKHVMAKSDKMLLSMQILSKLSFYARFVDKGCHFKCKYLGNHHFAHILWANRTKNITSNANA